MEMGNGITDVIGAYTKVRVAGERISLLSSHMDKVKGRERG